MLLSHVFELFLKTRPVSVTAVYRKLDQMELGISEAIVLDSFERTEPVIRKLRTTAPSWLSGCQVKMGGSEHRMEELRHTWAALPGKALVMFD